MPARAAIDAVVQAADGDAAVGEHHEVARNAALGQGRRNRGIDAEGLCQHAHRQQPWQQDPQCEHSRDPPESRPILTTH